MEKKCFFIVWEKITDTFFSCFIGKMFFFFWLVSFLELLTHCLTFYLVFGFNLNRFEVGDWLIRLIRLIRLILKELTKFWLVIVYKKRTQSI